MFGRDVSVPDATHTVTGGFEECCTGGIIGLSVARIVRVALKLQDEPPGRAVEIHDEAVQDVLATKLQAKDAPVPQ